MTTRDKWYQLLGSMALLVPLLPMLLTFTAGAYAQQSDSSESLDTWPMTVAEASGFTATANEAQVNSFLGQLVQTWPAAQLVEIGRSVEQRPIWAVVVQPQVRQDERPLTAMVLGGIHSGECDGKEAILALLRDFAAGQYAKDWRSLRMIFVPNFNVDGGERRSPNHRPGQAGPSEGMGLRENAQGLDLNRDFVKLESPEVQSLVAAIDRYEVDVLIDTHTTNGSLHRYELTYDIPHVPTLTKDMDHWLRTKLVPQVTANMAELGFSTFYYGNFDADHRAWTSYGHQPRYSTEYMGLRGRIGVLSESYSYASYETRVRASYAFVRQVLAVVSEQASQIRQLVQDADSTAQPGRSLPIRGQMARTAEGVVALGFEKLDGTPPSGPYGPDSAKQHAPKDYQVELWNRTEVTKQVTLPAAYVIPRQYAWAASRLTRHGVMLAQLQQDITTKTEAYRVTNVAHNPPFQGHRGLSVQVESRELEQTLHAGDYYVAVQQPLGVLAAYLLEPESEDSLATWNFFDPDIAEGNIYPTFRLPEMLPAELLLAVEGVDSSEQLTLEHLYQPERIVSYTGAELESAVWLPNRAEYVIKRNNNFIVVDAASGAVRPMHEARTLAEQLATFDSFTPEEANAAAETDALKNGLKHALINHKRDLYYFDSESNQARALTVSPDSDEQLAELNPQGTQAAFVRENDLWTIDCKTSDLRRLTSDGSERLLNGILDWVYQEELYGRGKFKAFWWSPDGQRLAFLKLDQSTVDQYQVSDSIHYRQHLEGTRYPKAGDSLPRVEVWIAELATGALRQVDLKEFEADDRLVARVTWAPSGELWLQILNRVQNRHSLVRVEPNSGAANTFLSESTDGWIEIRGTPQFLPTGDFLWLSDLPNGQTHLFRVLASDGSRIQLTNGDWDVNEFLSISTDNTKAFVTGNIQHPTQRHLICVNLLDGSFRQVTTAAGTHDVRVDASGRYFLDTYSNANQPPLVCVRTIDDQMLHVVSARASDRHEYLDIQPIHRTVITARDGVPLQAVVMLPSNVNRLAPDQRLPVVFYVYGGPQAPTVRDQWNGRYYWWHQYLCQQGFAVVLCDNRSALGRGVKDTWSIRGDMGRVEMRDLEDAVGWVQQQAWADPDRLGIWGWSYGGYFSAYAMTHSELFRAGIAGAPVTDWRNYDAIYTERYMGLPQDNSQGYDSSSVVLQANQLHGRLMLIHGERDDNVHISNTLQLAYALQNAGKQFDLMIYPKNRHGITDVNQKYHLQKLMTNFFIEHLRNR